MLIDIRRRIVQHTDRRFEGHQSERFAHVVRQAVVPDYARHGIRNRFTQQCLRQPLAARVDRGEGVGQRRAFIHAFYGGVHHLIAKEAMAQLAAHAQTLAHRHLGCLAAVKIQEAHRQQTGAVAEFDHQLTPWTVLHITVTDHALDLNHQPGSRCSLVNRQQLRLVFVTHWQVEHQRHVGRQAQPRQFVAGAEAFLGRGFFSGSGHGRLRWLARRRIPAFAASPPAHHDLRAAASSQYPLSAVSSCTHSPILILNYRPS